MSNTVSEPTGTVCRKLPLYISIFTQYGQHPGIMMLYVEH
jgi:hypothetical protein